MAWRRARRRRKLFSISKVSEKWKNDLENVVETFLVKSAYTNEKREGKTFSKSAINRSRKTFYSCSNSEICCEVKSVKSSSARIHFWHCFIFDENSRKISLKHQIKMTEFLKLYGFKKKNWTIDWKHLIAQLSTLLHSGLHKNGLSLISDFNFSSWNAQNLFALSIVCRIIN